MHEGGGRADVSPKTSFVLALKPRQVLLEELQRNLAVAKAMERKRPENSAQQEESVLICSIALWLQNKGLLKVLKRFISATQIQDDDWKARALNLSEIFSKYLDTCNDTDKDNTKKKLEEPCAASAEQTGAHCAVSEGIVSEKKKKKKGNVPAINSERTSEDAAIKEKANESNLKLQSEKDCKTNGALIHGEQKSKTFNESTMEIVCELTPELGDESVKKQKDKKKKKSESTITAENQLNAISEMTKGKQKDLLSVASNGKQDSEVIVEMKDKKKKKKMKTDDLVADDMNYALGIYNKVFSDKNAEALDSEKPIDTASKKKSVEAAGVVVKESKRSSKKRKGLASDENEELPILDVVVGQSKRRKTDGVETQITLPGANGQADSHNKEENFQVGRERQAGEILDGDPNNGAEKLNQPKSAAKQHKNSAEPKTVNAFQRVKIGEVEYVDERLQDNSYWAKDGAESGYGAKAQEILGQVKGRGFRHEKTKKKRGSYRGGQIDLQSHSIKFNYTDDD
ncbi:uncharacterized protein LOC142551888 [Primulina tabacum]|uniref:uncharacterized protein LOC142551888 n=1 Tax=Primulina tabacum TaxID=48773 RepID=UPI003F599DC4